MSTCSESLIQDAMFELIQNEDFYANMIMGMVLHKRYDIPTAGVNVTENINLYINPHFWKGLDLKGQTNVLKHECMHVLNNHFARFKELAPEQFEKKERTLKETVETMQNASTLNMAADFAINEYLDLPKTFHMYDKDGKVITQPDKILDKNGNEIDNPDAGKPIECEPCLVDSLRKQFPKVQNRQTMEYYYDFIKQEQQKQQKNGQGQGNGKNGKNQSKLGQGNGQPGGTVIDDHGLWAEGAEDEEYVKEKIKAMVNKAAEQTKDRQAGNIPGDVQQLIDALNYQGKNWKSELRKFVARTSEILVESSRKKRNRRYGVQFPGRKTFPKMHLAVAIDTSGSVGDEELAQFLAEIDRIHKNNVKVTVIECDSQVNGVFEFDPRKQITFNGRGGTMFGPAFEEAKKHEIDGLIYLTDGENWEDSLKKPKFPVMWALLPGCKVRYDWGYKTNISINKKNNI